MKTKTVVISIVATLAGIWGCGAPQPERQQRHSRALTIPEYTTSQLPTNTVEDVAARLAEIGVSAPDSVPPPSYKPAPYVAFSLRVAQKQIEVKQVSGDYRPSLAEVYYLGGITRVRGAVYDRDSNDLIIVGARESGQPALTLDDLAVALRSRFIHGRWPLVSIDPTSQTKETQMQHIRYEGGIRDTAFGRDMFDADLRLKAIGLGLIDSGVSDVKSKWVLNVERIKQGQSRGNSRISARFWFYPACPSVTVREDVVAVKGLKVSVFTEVLSAILNDRPVEDLANFRDPTGDQFALQVSEHHNALGQVHRSIGRLRGLLELVALSHAIEQMADKPDLTYWLKTYVVKHQSCPRQQEVLRRRWNYELRGVGRFYEQSGGVHLTALALRLQAGDVIALKEAVLETRQNSDSLLWTFIVTDWIIPTSSGMLELEDLVGLFSHARFLAANQRNSEAITVYGKIIELQPNLAEAYYNRGCSYDDKGEFDRAITDYDKAIELKPDFVEAWTNKGNVLRDLKRHKNAIKCCEQALVLNPDNVEAWINKGASLFDLGQYEESLQCADKALSLDQKCAKAWYNKGGVLNRLGRHKDAIMCCDKALSLNPEDVGPWYNKGVILNDLGRYEEAIQCFNQALSLDPDLVEAWINKAVALGNLNRYEDVILCCDKALLLNPDNARAWNNKGIALGNLNRYEDVILCCDKALLLDPDDARAWNNKGNALDNLGRCEDAIRSYEKALSLDPDNAMMWDNKARALWKLNKVEDTILCWNKALSLNPDNTEAWTNMGAAFGKIGQHKDSIRCFDKALSLNPNLTLAWYNKGIMYYRLKRYEEAQKCFEKAKVLGHPQAQKALRVIQQEGH